MFGLTRFEWLFLLAAVLLCPGMSFGQVVVNGSNGAGAALFDRLDRNRDGYLSSAELTSDEAKTTNWIAVDRNRDGRISRAEFGLVEARSATAQQQPSAAAGASAPPKAESPKKE
jgi:hypothetical protein